MFDLALLLTLAILFLVSNSVLEMGKNQIVCRQIGFLDGALVVSFG